MMKPGEKCFEFLFKASTTRTIPEFFDFMDNDSNMVGGYRGVTVNLVMADNAGNIGYQLVAPLPIRKDKTPFIGLRVLDGRKSDFDWVGDGIQTAPLKDLARSLNPSKGYVASANNKITSANA